MARRLPPGGASAAALSTPFASQAENAAHVAVPSPSLPGGAAGVLPGATTKIHFPGEANPGAHVGPDPEDAPKVERFRVVDCPKPPGGPHGFRVLLNGMISYMADGKVVDTNCYDVDMLRRQGVKLQPIEDDAEKKG